ncbi:MAG: alkaline phosphatase family protein [Melioribacteraceae bacterium]|nr:alkaline phosphatase family protein [Melioribacteraceae bacterium]
MSKAVLSVFADGVRYDSLQYMPFVNSLKSVPLKSVLGYSITCHPSMYTGVNPDKHNIAFHWVKGKKKYGPYTPLSFFPNFFPFSNPYVQAVFSHFYSKLFLKKKARPFMGYGKILNLPMKFWNKLDINETKYWDEDNYISEEIKTIFELVRKKDIKYNISGMHKPNLGKLDALSVVSPRDYEWVYYFIGDADHISHEYNQHSKEGVEFLKKLDGFIKERYNEFVDVYGEGGFDLIFWSDHGHIPIKKKYNLYDELNKQGINLKKIFHIIDSTTARFWVDNLEQESKLISAMKKIPEANLVCEEDYKIQNLPKDTSLYGDLFFYLDGGATFTYTIHGFGLKTKSMHGYHPDAEGNLGLFVSNKNISTQIATLPDVFVSTINSLSIPYEPKIELDGKDILSR